MPSFSLEIRYASAGCHIVVRNTARFNDYDGNNPEKVERNRIQANSGNVIREVVWMGDTIGSPSIKPGAMPTVA